MNTVICFGQNSDDRLKNLGLPFIENFTSEDYNNAHRQNWCTIQDKEGKIYVGNTSGLLIYDGARWHHVSSSADMTIRSLAMDGEGRIYYGAVNDFGYISNDKLGRITFESLRKYIPNQELDIRDVWSIAFSENQVYFQTRTQIFKFDNSKLDQCPDCVELIENQEPKQPLMYGISAIKDANYYGIRSEGLFRIKNNVKEVMAGSEFIVENGLNILEIIPFFDTEDLMIVTLSQGIFKYDGKNISEFISPNGLLAKKSIIDVLLLPDRRLLIATRSSGIILVDYDGQLLHKINKESGLSSSGINGSFIDREGGVWLTTDNGISRLEMISDFRTYSENEGISGVPYRMAKHDGRLYVGTNSGLYRSTTSGDKAFEKVKDISNVVFSILSFEDELLIAIPSRGIYSLKDDSLVKLFDKGLPAKLVRSRYNPNLVLNGSGGTDYAFSVLYKLGSGWKRIHTNPVIKGEIREIMEDSAGVIWLGTRNKGFAKMIIPSLQDTNTPLSSILIENDSLKAIIERFPEASQMTFKRARLYRIDEQIVFATDKGLKRINYESKPLAPEPRIHNKLADTTAAINIMHQGQDGDIWAYTSASDNSIAKLSYNIEKKEYEFREIPAFNRMLGTVFTGTYLDEDNSNILWLGTPEGLIRYEEANISNEPYKYTTTIGQIVYDSDSLLYAGNNYAETTDYNKFPFNFSKNKMRFEYGLPSFDQASKSSYKVFLEGLDDNWSEWTTETQKDYTNLPGGSYNFKVKSKNIYGEEAETSIFSFTILPPWHLSWWAFLMYVLAGILLLYWIYHYRLNHLKKRNLELESIVELRTEKIKAQAEELKTLDQLKSSFFTNITHEFKTPLAIIDGVVEKIKEQPEQWLKKGYSLIKHNSANLLDLVSQILELKKLETGNITLNNKHDDIIVYLRKIIDQFKPLVDDKGLTLTYDSSTPNCEMDFDSKAVLRIVSNLISNAIKYTPVGGAIEVKSYVTSDNENQDLNIVVIDTGIGIGEENFQRIFDEFFQENKKFIHSSHGTGIGLAIIKRLVDLMNGYIDLESEVNKGTTFTVKIPITHYASNNTEEMELFRIDQNTDWSSWLVARNIELQDNDQLPDKESPNLLIVEDSTEMMEFLKYSLEENFQLSFAVNGKEGIEKAIEEVPDLILSDVMMPLTDGYELCKTLKEDIKTSHIPIVLLTAKTDHKSRLMGIEQGADAYLEKPFDQNELFLQIYNLLKVRTILRERYGALDIPEESDSVSFIKEDEFVIRFKDFVEMNLDNSEFGTKELCAAMGMSRAHLHRKIKALTGRSTSLYIRLIRLQNAKKLLSHTSLNVSEVAYSVGFSNPSYFSRMFTEEFGDSPTSFKT